MNINLHLVGFSQTSETRLHLVFNKKIVAGHAVFKKDIPTIINISDLQIASEEKVALELNGKSFYMEIPPSIEPNTSEYSIIFILSIRETLLNQIVRYIGWRSQSVDYNSYYLEVVRQSPGWLKSVFNFDYKKGYNILGRRSLLAGNAEKSSISLPIIFNGIRVYQQK